MRELEERYADELVVVGVHAGKFRAERVTANIAAAAQRLGVEHPIVNDRQFRVWRSFGVGAWPTVVVLDPAGGVVGAVPGEFLAGQLAPTLDAVIAEFDRADAPEGARLRRGPAPLSLPPAPTGPLAYPGKVLAGANGRLFVADTGHHRVLELEVDPEIARAHVLRVIGSGSRGSADGSADVAAFDHPEGMAVTPGRLIATGLAFVASSETLFVADAGNHAVRAVDLPSGAVSTVAGTGEQARRVNEAGHGTTVPLSSPWDVELLPAPPESTLSLAPTVIVAMAGVHQLWRIDLVTRSVEPWVGHGPRGHHGRTAVPLHAGATRRSAACRPPPVLRRLRVQRRALRRSGRPRRPRGRDHRGQGPLRLRRRGRTGRASRACSTPTTSRPWTACWSLRTPTTTSSSALIRARR